VLDRAEKPVPDFGAIDAGGARSTRGNIRMHRGTTKTRWYLCAFYNAVANAPDAQSTITVYGALETPARATCTLTVPHAGGCVVAVITTKLQAPSPHVTLTNEEGVAVQVAGDVFDGGEPPGPGATDADVPRLRGVKRITKRASANQVRRTALRIRTRIRMIPVVTKANPSAALSGAANGIFGGALPNSNPGTLAYAIAVDAAGNAYVAGSTFDAAFPVTASAFDGEFC
jgi:hypothetical protein